MLLSVAVLNPLLGFERILAPFQGRNALALLQPTTGYMRLLKESVLQIWKARKTAVREEIEGAERAAKAIQQKLDRLDETDC